MHFFFLQLLHAKIILPLHLDKYDLVDDPDFKNSKMLWDMLQNKTTVEDRNAIWQELLKNSPRVIRMRL